MSLPTRLQQAAAAARRRRAASVLLVAAPALALAAVLVWRSDGGIAALVLLGVVVSGAAALAWRAAGKIDARWLARRLDQRPDLQDSADLLFADPAALTGLQGLQRQRLLHLLGTGAAPDLRPAWPMRRLLIAWSLGLPLAAAVALWPVQATRSPASASMDTAAAAIVATATHTTLIASQLRIQPPAYTGLPARSEPGLSAQAPAGAQLRWTLRLAPPPAAVDLVFHDGSRLPLRREGEDWVAARALEKSALYRIAPGDALPLQDDVLHRLDIIADQPPQVRVIEPEHSLTLATPGQRTWPLAFEASDDHGLGSARLDITLAQGSGEQVTVTERRLALAGVGDRRLKRYAHRLDLAALGLAEGDDLIVRLVVSDNRRPAPQSTRSASLILRWPPPPSTDSTGMEGLVKKALPAYFRSQRQVIIDAEALVAQRPRLAADAFVQRSDGIGVDQRILRMRYGQFLGEKSEGEPEPPPAADGEEHTDDDGHSHGPEPPASFGDPVDVLEDYGHTHDEAEAATLLDPETRALLRQALDAMWLSEGELRQGQPERALPHAYRALGFIKQVQQATRIYLARVGLELPPIDEGRRMTGDRAGLGDRRSGLVAAAPGQTPALPLWRALASRQRSDGELQAFADWVRVNEAKTEDPLSLVAAIEALRADPDCADCRQQLRRLLWPLLPRPAAAATARPVADARGQAYLDALARERSP